MTRVFRYARALALLLATVSPLAAQRPDLAAFDRYVAQGVRDWRIPGLAIAIVKDDSVVFAKGYGVRETGRPDAVDEHTLFAIGSTTKAMTAASILMLRDEGKLRLTDRVQQYLPSLQLYDPDMTRELNVGDLLTHHTGLPTFDLLWAGGDYTISEIIARLRWLKPTASFRNAYAYQNIQYAMAGEVLRAAGGVPWTEFVRQRIFAPLGMQETVTLLAETAGKPNVARPHFLIRDTVRVVPNRSVDPVAPAGSIWSSVSDMARWMRFVLDSGRAGGKQVLTRASFTEWLSPQIVVPAGSFYPTTALTRPHFITYGLGWFLHDYAGSAVAMHTGSIDGMIAIVGLVPDQRLGVVVLANLDHAELRHALMLRVLDMYAGRPSRDWSSELRTLYGNLERRGEEARQAFLRTRVSGTSPSLPLERYAGTYVDSLSGTVEISKRGERLHAAFGKGFRGWLEHWHYDTFVVHWEGEVNGEQVVTMVLDEKGSPDRLRTDFGAVTIEFSRRRP